MAGLRLLLVDEFGNKRTLSDNVYVGPEQPTNTDTLLWIDTTSNPPAFKYLSNGTYLNLNSAGSWEVSTVSDLPTDTKLIIANLTGDDQLSVAGQMVPGQELHIIISGFCSVTVPGNGDYVNLTDDVIDVDGYAEINIISDGTKKYIRSI